MGSPSNSNRDGSTVLPLQALLELLRGKGLPIGTRECERIRLLLSVRHDWRIDQLQTALRSVLARDADERVLFDSCFYDLFDDCIEAERSATRVVPTFDLDRALEELRGLHRPSPPPAPPDVDHRKSDGDSPPVPPVRPPWRTVALTTVVLVGLGALVTWWLFRNGGTPAAATQLSIDPPAIAFDVVEEDQIGVEYVRITNDGTEPTRVRQVAITGDHADHFDVQSLADKREFSIKPSETRVIAIHFARRSEGLSTAQLTVTHDGLNKLPSVSLRAQRAAPKPLDVADFTIPPGFTDPVYPGDGAGRLTIDRIRTIKVKLDPDNRLFYLLVVTAALVALNLLWWLVNYIRHRPPKDRPAPWRPNEDGEQFSFRDIGGTPDPTVPLRAVNRLGDLLGFFRADDPGQNLDLDRSIQASIDAGYPRLCFESLVQTREVVILEDSSAHPDFRSSLVDELSAGLHRTGVTLHRCWFDGRVDEFHNRRGGTLKLNELPHDPDAYVFLLITDGRGLRSRQAIRSLHALAQFPRVAWIDLREPRFRMDRNALARGHGIPVFSATVEGLKSALRALLVSGRRLRADESRSDLDQPILSSTFGMGTEAALGDAVLWAADCACLQPCSVALAEQLRQKFHPRLPSTRIQRFFQLDGTSRDAAGFTFDVSTQGELQSIWLARRPLSGDLDDRTQPATQDNVLQFLMQQIQAAEPVVSPDRSQSAAASLAHLKWQSAREWIRLSMDRTNSLERFSHVQQTPSGGWLTTQLTHVSEAGTSAERPVRLRFTIEDRLARHRMSRMNRSVGVKPPSGPGKRTAAIRGVVSVLLCVFAAAVLALNPPPEPAVWAVKGPSSERLVLMARADGEEQFHDIGTWNQDWTLHSPVRQTGRQYAVRLRADGNAGDQQDEPSVPLSLSEEDSSDIVEITLARKGDATYRMLPIRPGKFQMGSPASEADREDDETQHEVTLTRGFLLGQTEVTQGLYKEVMDGKNPSHFSDAGWNAPVENVSWKEAIEFCRKLTERNRSAKPPRLPDGWVYTLPTEAQWEYACRAGSQTAYSFGDDPAKLGEYAWFGDKSESETHLVGAKKPNAWVLYDMHGNVYEWCRDVSDIGDYAPGAATDPLGKQGSLRVIRGGCWFISARLCRSAYRDWYVPSYRSSGLGFRVAAVQSGEPSKSETEGRRRAIALAWIPAGIFQMGSPLAEEGRFDENETQHEVTLTQGFYLSQYEITQGQYEDLMQKNPSTFKTSGWNAPVETVTWDQAMEFCEKLTTQARADGRLPDNWIFTLPTEAQWEYACRAGATTAYSFGGDPTKLGEYAWFGGNAKSRTHPVGKRKPNAWGLYGMHGNVWEWCRDSWDGDDYESGATIDPLGTQGSFRVVRGGGWDFSAQVCRSAFRYGIEPSNRYDFLGFRVAAVQSSEPSPSETEGRRRAIADSMVLIHTGTFQMGSPPEEEGRFERDETQHQVTLTQDFELCQYEVTQRQYLEITGKNPSKFAEAGLDFPVDSVSWEEAMEFCRKLTERDHVSGRLAPDREYTLPTEAQWEYACRAGTTTAYSYGDDRAQLGDYAWSTENSGKTTHTVGGKKPNAWGLHDMHGNVYEWCRDSWDGVSDYASGAATDPVGTEGSYRVIRGGCWFFSARYCRSAIRGRFVPSDRFNFLGFRVAAVQSRQRANE